MILGTVTSSASVELLTDFSRARDTAFTQCSSRLDTVALLAVAELFWQWSLTGGVGAMGSAAELVVESE